MPDTPSSERVHAFGMSNTPFPERHAFGMSDTPSLKDSFGISNTPLLLPEGKSDFGMDITSSLSLVLKQSDFRMRNLLSPDPQDNLGAHTTLLPESQGFGIYQPTGAEEPLGSSSKNWSEFHITNALTHLILLHAAWKWGDPALSLGSSKHSQASTGKCMHELVCCIVHMLV
jgi:hypothetical protein